MMDQRTCVRAPYYHEMLLVSQENVFLATGRNISQKGALLANLPALAANCEIFLIFPLHLPPLYNSSQETLVYLEDNFSLTNYFKIKAKIKRQEGIGDRYLIGVTFIDSHEKFNLTLEQYIKRMEASLSYLLNWFEDEPLTQEKEKTLKQLSQHLGYHGHDGLNVVRQKMIRDYNNIAN